MEVTKGDITWEFSPTAHMGSASHSRGYGGAPVGGPIYQSQEARMFFWGLHTGKNAFGVQGHHTLKCTTLGDCEFHGFFCGPLEPLKPCMA